MNFRRQEYIKRIKYQHFNKKLLMILTAPVIYLQIFPAVILDVFVTIYQWVCFPVYGLDLVDRSQYIRFDRHHIKFLGPLEKINCLYCTYFNGVISYVREVAARTEKVWCPLKNLFRKDTHRYYRDFAERGNEDDFRNKYERSSFF